MKHLRCHTRRFASGVVCLHSGDDGRHSIDLELRKAHGFGTFGFAIVFFSKSCCTHEDIVTLMKQSAPDLRYAACSTAGELTPNGLAEGEMVVLLFPASVFRIAAKALTTLRDGGMDRVVEQVRAFKKEFLESSSNGTSFGLCLLDGASFMEEAITAAIHWGLEEVPLLGGSAGDNLDFEKTMLILDGELVSDSAIFILVHTDLPTEIFKTENFVPGSEKLVVTRSDPDRRIVHEFNAAPAALAYAEIIGTDPGSLTPQSFASHPLVMRVGGEYYCRSIQRLNEDHSLSFFCAVDDGIVLSVAEQTGMARSTRKALGDISARLGGLDFVLGFDCVLRRIDARNRQVTQIISEIYCEHNVLGFNTYGEQYRSMHLNQTLTGVAFGLSKTGVDVA